MGTNVIVRFSEIFQHLSVYVCVSGDDLFQIRGRNGLLQCSMDPLPEVCGKQEVADTSDHVLETFYPVSPTIDLQQINVYEEKSCTGELSSSPHFNKPTVSWFPETDLNTRTGFMKFSGYCLTFHLGFKDDYHYPHAHTLYFLESTERKFRLSHEQFRAKMVMFTFGNCLARAHKLYGVRMYRGTHFNNR